MPVDQKMQTLAEMRPALYAQALQMVERAETNEAIARFLWSRKINISAEAVRLWRRRLVVTDAQD